MKLYTEEEIKRLLKERIIFDDDDLEELTPIELPSDEEIETYINSIDKYHIFNDFYCDGFANGAKWTRDKIQELKKP